MRLLWDELLSPRVPRALRELGLPTTHVGSADHGVPERGSSDEEVLAFAQQRNQVIVTSNHDMMELCAEAAQRFVWIDPRGRQLRLAEQVVLVFTQIERWERLLDEDGGACVRALRTRCDRIEPEEAVRLARQRMVSLERRRRRRATPAPTLLGGLVDPAN